MLTSHTSMQHTTHIPQGVFLRSENVEGMLFLEVRSWKIVLLCVGEGVPVADLLSLSLLHLCPVGLLLLAGAVEAQGDPAQPLPGPHAAPAAEHRHH